MERPLRVMNLLVLFSADDVEDSPVHRQIWVLGVKIVDESLRDCYPLVDGRWRSDRQVAAHNELAQAAVGVLDLQDG